MRDLGYIIHLDVLVRVDTNIVFLPLQHVATIHLCGFLQFLSLLLETHMGRREIYERVELSQGRVRLIANRLYSLAPPQQSASSPASPWPPRQQSSLHTSACRTAATAALQETALALLKRKNHCRHSHPTPSSKMIHPLMTESGIGLILAPPHGAALQLGSYHRRFSKKRTILNYRFPLPPSSPPFSSFHESTLAT